MHKLKYRKLQLTSRDLAVKFGAKRNNCLSLTCNVQLSLQSLEVVAHTLKPIWRTHGWHKLSRAISSCVVRPIGQSVQEGTVSLSSLKQSLCPRHGGPRVRKRLDCFAQPLQLYLQALEGMCRSVHCSSDAPSCNRRLRRPEPTPCARCRGPERTAGRRAGKLRVT